MVSISITGGIMTAKKVMKEYISSLKKNPYSYWGIPFQSLSTEEILELLNVNGRCISQVPKGRITKKMCTAAVENDPSALEFVPERFKSVKMCQKAYEQNTAAFPYVLPTMYTIEFCIDCYKRLQRQKNISVSLSKISSAFPEEYHDDKRIFKLERRLGIRKVKSKRYINGKFKVTEDVSYSAEPLVTYFEKFNDFYKFIDKDLSGAILMKYDFEGIDLKGMDISGACISSEVLVRQGLYDSSYFCENVKSPEEETALVPFEPQEIIPHTEVSGEGLTDDIHRLYYVSDLHLNHKLQMQFPEKASENEIRHYVKYLASKVALSRTDSNYGDFLLIAGDVSYNYKIAEIFFTQLVKLWDAQHIIVVLGNHELWDYGSQETPSVESIIEKYRKLFHSLNIHYLQNDILIVTGEYPFRREFRIISEEEILQNTSAWLSEQCLKSRLTIVGGLGFSGENTEFNAEHALYRNTVTSLESDREYTKRFYNIYCKAEEAFNHAKAVVLTHTPYKDWNRREPVANWIYINGHTHMNFYCISDELTQYADNQSGYYTKNLSLKHFELTAHYDIFSAYLDGIYEITREEYLDFTRGIMVDMMFNRIDGQILMLKREGMYCFFYKDEKERLYLLKGGSIRKLKNQDIKYYYETMVVYKRSMEYVMRDYHNALRMISGQVKQFGGSGRIHGNVVDIDKENHIYLNPATGEIKCYWAEAIDYRIEYPSIEALLNERRLDLFLEYQRLISENCKTGLMNFGNGKIDISGDALKLVTDTSMYAPSNMFRSLQYMFDVNVIREWNEDVVERAIAKYMNQSKNLVVHETHGER